MDQWSALRFFRERETIKKTLNRLPHWQQEGACYFVTFRLADSLPEQMLRQFRQERETWLHLHPEPWNDAMEAEYHNRFSAKLDRWLDDGHGECRLDPPRSARVVSDALAHFDGDHYLIHCHVVMPNHVHVLMSVPPAADLAAVVSSWKSFSARRINHLDGRSGAFWQRDYFDRLIRDIGHFRNVVRYIRRNARGSRNSPSYEAEWMAEIK